MTLLQSFFLGFVQGVTEFLPISSSAHLILIPWFFRWEDPGLAYDLVLHLGTLGAVLIYFARDWINLVRAGLISLIERRIGYERERRLFWLIITGTIPACLAGYFFHEQAETVFRSPLIICVSLTVVGFLIYWIDDRYASIKSIDELTWTGALLVGIAQAVAIIPGISRSGGTMAMARLLGFSREASARFSFLLSVPILLAASIFKLLDWLVQSPPLSISILLGGFFSSMLFGLLSIHFLLIYLRTADFRVFAWYRVILAGVVLLWSFAFKY